MGRDLGMLVILHRFFGNDVECCVGHINGDI